MLIVSKTYSDIALNNFSKLNICKPNKYLYFKETPKQISTNIIFVILLLNQAINNWTSLSVICFGVCELTIRCQYSNHL